MPRKNITSFTGVGTTDIAVGFGAVRLAAPATDAAWDHACHIGSGRVAREAFEVWPLGHRNIAQPL
ncbi:MAG: hypothetical protein BGP09_28865 [Rhizobium sp. 60-20]|nr:MAG: hypothetical protein BGP09_28865 [Rhizobium sp. 60-20]